MATTHDPHELTAEQHREARGIARECRRLNHKWRQRKRAENSKEQHSRKGWLARAGRALQPPASKADRLARSPGNAEAKVLKAAYQAGLSAQDAAQRVGVDRALRGMARGS
jgi:hypothetical protein